MNQETTIVLCGGTINRTSLPIGTNFSNAMIPINGKPVISWILDDLLSKQIRHVIVVLREEDQRFPDFLSRIYAHRMQLAIVPVQPGGTILHSLWAGLQCSKELGLVRVILGDTLIRDSYAASDDFVYVGKVEDSKRWCLAVTNADGKIVDFIDKKAMPPSNRCALAGYYHLQHGQDLKNSVEQSIAQSEHELSDVLRRYTATYPLKARLAQEWYDFGHIDNLVDARRRLLQPRYFNSLSINPVLNTITKVSEHNEKLEDELGWYLQIPEELKILTPRLVNYERVNGRLHIVQEYYGYPTLAELYVYADLHEETWNSILRHVLRIHQAFRRFSGQLSYQDIHAMYLDKTWQRLDELEQQGPYWRRLLQRETVIFNDHELRNIPLLKEDIRKRALTILDNAPISVIHGDFCFSNILFDANNQIIRLIDPRGSFGRKGIYGDARYDISKLRHSVASLYDYVIADMFEVQEEDGAFRGKIFAHSVSSLGPIFDQMIAEAGYDLDEIRFIEGLLFISMLPLHRDHFLRQQIMYLSGLSLLNEVL